MSWNYHTPKREDYDSEEEYQEAVAYYESAEDEYLSRCEENY